MCHALSQVVPFQCRPPESDDHECGDERSQSSHQHQRLTQSIRADRRNLGAQHWRKTRLLRHLRRNLTDGCRRFSVLNSSSKAQPRPVLRVRLSIRENTARSSAATANFGDPYAVEQPEHLYIQLYSQEPHSEHAGDVFDRPPAACRNVFWEKRVMLSTNPRKFPPHDGSATITNQEWRPIGRQLPCQLAS
jgi:hypothetical protein